MERKKFEDCLKDQQLREKDIRNSIDYRGVVVSHDMWKNNELKIKLIIKALKEYVRKRLE